MVTAPHTEDMTTTTVSTPSAPRTSAPGRHVVRSFNPSDREFALRFRSALYADPAVTARLADLEDLTVTRVPGR